MELNLINQSRMKDLAYIQRTCIFENEGKVINPYQFIQEHKEQGCNEAVIRIVPKIDMKEVSELLKDTPTMTKVNYEFCKNVLEIRLHDILEPALERSIR